MRKYLFNENYFEKVNNEEKAYWLGFITADGGINIPGHGRPSGYVLCINLKGDDKGHLEKFQTALGRKGPIYDAVSNFNTSVARLQIGCKKFVCDLIKLGLSPKKSFSCKPWKGKKSLMRHYWRGVFDGDGSISKIAIKLKKGGSYPAWKLALNGNERFVDAFRNFVIGNGCYKEGCKRPHYNIYKIAWGGVLPPKQIVNIIYKDANIFLERKMVLAKELMNYESRRIKN